MGSTITFFAAERAAVLDGLTSNLPSALSQLPQADFSLHLDPGVLDDLTAALTESLGEPRRSFFDEVLVEQLWTDGEASRASPSWNLRRAQQQPLEPER